MALHADVIRTQAQVLFHRPLHNSAAQTGPASLYFTFAYLQVFLYN